METVVFLQEPLANLIVLIMKMTISPCLIIGSSQTASVELIEAVLHPIIKLVCTLHI